MRRLKFLIWLPAIIAVFAIIYGAWLAGRATSSEWRWFTLLIICHGIMLFPLSFWPAIAGTWTIIALKMSGFAR